MTYRGYELVQWFDHGPIDISQGAVYVTTEHVSRLDVTDIVDEWLDAK